MAVTPTGIFSLPLARVRTLLCASATWQEWVEADDATEAAEHVRFYEIGKDEAASLRPWALIGHNDQWGWVKIAEVSHAPDWSVILWFEAVIPEAYQAADKIGDAVMWFTNKVGAVLEEMLALCGTSGYPNALTIRLFQGPERPEEKLRTSEGDYFAVAFEVTGGLRS